MISRNLLISDEALVRFREKLDSSITKETLVFREINELGEIVLVLKFPVTYVLRELGLSVKVSFFVFIN
jgi:hypothetical protein